MKISRLFSGWGRGHPSPVQTGKRKTKLPDRLKPLDAR
jgi:hypothetical protein